MPVERGYTTEDGKKVGYYRWGKSGKKYTYNPGNDKARERAKKKAARQGRAIKSGGSN